MKNILVSLLILLSSYTFIFSHPPESEIKNIAVLSFTPRGLSDVEAQVISDRVRITIKKMNRYTVIERDLMDKILTEQNFQQTGCTESECIVELGKILSVKYVVGGTVSKIGKRYTIEIKLIEVETSRILKSVVKDYSLPVEVILSKKIPELTTGLFLNINTKQEESKKNIAVVEFDARGLSKTEAAIISDRVRIELQNTNSYVVLERDVMTEILKEHALQQTGCTDQSCLVEIGRILAVEKMVGGSISKIGNLYVIEARIIDVKTGKIEMNVAEDYSGPIELLLLNVTKKVAYKLAGLQVENEQPALVSTGETGDLYIESNPAGGLIYVDGVPLKDLTPYTIKNLPVGTHRVKVEKGTLVGEQSVSIIKGKLNRIFFELKEIEYSLIVYSQPSGANVKIMKKCSPEDIEKYNLSSKTTIERNEISKYSPIQLFESINRLYQDANVFTGTTPLDFSFRRTDFPIIVYIEKNGYFPYETVLDSTVELTTRIEAKLEKSGTLSVFSVPHDSKIYINGKYQGTTPKEFLAKMGNYEIDIINQDYKPFKRNVSLTPNKTEITVNTNLEALTDTLKLITEPDNTELSLFTNFPDSLSSLSEIDPEVASNFKAEKFDLNSPYLCYIEKRDFPVFLLLRKPGYFPFSVYLDSLDNSFSIMNISMQKAGGIFIKSSPEGVVYINNEYKGRTPYRSEPLKLGEYNLTLRKEGYHPIEQNITLTSAKPTVDLSYDLKPIKTTLSVLGYPEGAHIFLNGKLIGNTPLYDMNMKYGDYTVKIKKKGFKPHKEKLKVQKTEPYYINVELSKKSRFFCFLASSLLPGIGQMYYNNSWKGFPLTILALSSLGLNYYMNDQFVKSLEEYNYLTKKYDAAVLYEDVIKYRKLMNESYDQVRTNQILAFTSIGISAGLWIYNYFNLIRDFKNSEYTHNPQKNNKIQISLNGGKGIEAEYLF